MIDADELIEHLKKGPLSDSVVRYGLISVIKSRPTIDIKTIKAYSAGYEQGRFDEAVSSVIPVKCYECVFLDGCPVRQYLTNTNAGFCSDGERRKGGAR